MAGIPRRLFLTSGSLIMIAAAYVLLYSAEPDKTTLAVFLVLLFSLLSVEYIREGVEKRKHLTTAADK